jgi:hypothetical protein
MDKAALLQYIAAMLEDDNLTEALTEMYENERGGLGFFVEHPQAPATHL